MAYCEVNSRSGTPPSSTRYGSISLSLLGRRHAARNDKSLPSSKLDETRLQDGRDRLMRRALVATGMILMLGLSILAATLLVTDISEGEKNVRDFFQDASLPDLEARSIGELTLETTNEYGPSDKHALAMYGYEMVIEPFRDTAIHVAFSTAPASAQYASQYHWLMLPLDDDGVHRQSTGPVLNSRGGSHVNVHLEYPGRSYYLVVKQYGMDGKVIAEGRATVSCKYVRRELRALTEADRTAFFEAMRVFYTITTDEGKRLYGSDFSNSIQMSTVHNSENFCYHGGMHFPLAHAAFNLVVERSLQRINPRVSLASWDFMVESGTMGAEWPKSIVFSHVWFGSAFGNPENDYQIKDGYFANISSIFDPYDNLVDPRISPLHNPYGYLGGSYDYTDLGGVVRTHSFCGMRGEVVFPQCAVLVDCFESSKSLYEWTYCMESQVHATMHGLIGGGYNCNTDMEEFLQMHPEYSRGLLTFVLEYLLGSTWPSNHLMSNYNTCDTSCVHGQKTPCGCTCNTDPFEWSDAEVRAFMSTPLGILSAIAGADLWIDDTGGQLGFKTDGKLLSEDQNLFLLRTMMVIGCEPGAIGAMSNGASPTDPIFWVLHPLFEKALHIVNLSPKYIGSYNLDWVGSSCYGSDFTDELPFTEQALGMGNGTDFLTNEDLVRLFHPSNDRLTYMYDDFRTWGTCTYWDPCLECSDPDIVSDRRRTTHTRG